MKSLPLTVLVSEGAQARAYLVRMRRAGFRPERIVLMVASRRPGSRKPLAGWLPAGLRLAYAERHQTSRQRHWPRRLMVMESAAFERTRSVMAERCDGAEEIMDAIAGNLRYADYSDSVERVPVTGLRDPALADALGAKDATPHAVLYTGGGIVPPALLAAPGLRLIHVHPGHLPEVRGADGLFWSVLLRGRPGMSCFYMAAGIDTGDLVVTEDLAELAIPLAEKTRPGDEALYQMIFAFVDPLLRAEFFATRVLARQKSPAAMPAAAQHTSAGETYHFLHPELRRVALQRIFVSEGV